MSVELTDDVRSAVNSYCAGVAKTVRTAATITELRRQLDEAVEELRARHASDREWQSKAEAAVEEAGALRRELERTQKERADLLALWRAAEAKHHERSH